MTEPAACKVFVNTPVNPWTKRKEVRLILLKRTFVIDDIIPLCFITQVFVLLSAQYNYVD
jgi:hypothetical protein